MKAHDKLRAGDADREQTIERLRQASAEGRLDPEELDQRIEAALAAQTYGELEELVADLPKVESGPKKRAKKKERKRQRKRRRVAVALGALAAAAFAVLEVAEVADGAGWAVLGAWALWNFGAPWSWHDPPGRRRGGCRTRRGSREPKGATWA